MKIRLMIDILNGILEIDAERDGNKTKLNLN